MASAPAEINRVLEEGLCSEMLVNSDIFSGCDVGTRGPLDMIEIPSHFFESFIREPSCLRLCTRHHESGATLPPQAVDLFRSFCNDLPNLKMNDTVRLLPAFHCASNCQCVAPHSLSRCLRSRGADQLWCLCADCECDD